MSHDKDNSQKSHLEFHIPLYLPTWSQLHHQLPKHFSWCSIETQRWETCHLEKCNQTHTWPTPDQMHPSQGDERQMEMIRIRQGVSVKEPLEWRIQCQGLAKRMVKNTVITTEQLWQDTVELKSCRRERDCGCWWVRGRFLCSQGKTVKAFHCIPNQ